MRRKRPTAAVAVATTKHPLKTTKLATTHNDMTHDPRPDGLNGRDYEFYDKRKDASPPRGWLEKWRLSFSASPFHPPASPGSATIRNPISYVCMFNERRAHAVVWEFVRFVLELRLRILPKGVSFTRYFGSALLIPLYVFPPAPSTSSSAFSLSYLSSSPSAA